MRHTQGLSQMRYNKIVPLANSLRDEGLARHAYVGDSFDGASIYWPSAKLTCFSIVIDEESDVDIREMDGVYFVCQVGHNHHATYNEMFTTPQEAFCAIRKRLLWC